MKELNYYLSSSDLLNVDLNKKDVSLTGFVLPQTFTYWVIDIQ